ncbi:MAG: Ig-like domain-containing protein [Eubacteriales bacterium]|nr:Ig-like domain-containing protein [Eubacteriales bacterium]MDD4421593.1 Ig-like domain-containing protein [Eubacteriales bacterium]
MRIKKYIAIVIALLLILPASAFNINADASEEYISNLSTYKQYFRRTIGSFARADMYENRILASVTVAQAILESGWGQSSRTDLPEVGKNLFGIRTYSDWGGKIYDAENNIICSNLIEYGIIDGADYSGWGWRAYDSWVDSINDHSALLNTSGYAIIPGMTDYKAVCNALVECNYTKDANYIESLIAAIENYDLTVFDDINPNEHKVIAIKMSDAEKVLDLDGSVTLTAEVLGSTDVTQPLTWASANEEVATVDQNGIITAKSEGYTLITASIGNREACCIVKVLSRYNARVTVNLNVRDKAGTDGAKLGEFRKDQAINVTGDAVDGWYPVSGVSTDGIGVTGWSFAEYITLTPVIETENNIKVGLSRFEINRDVGKTYQFRYAVGSTYPIDKTLTWTSSDPTVASVDQGGLVTMHKYGTATITATAVGGASASCVVNVTTEQVKYTAHAVTSLYIRSDDSASAKAVGFFDKKSITNQNIIVTDNYYNAEGLIDDEWYYVEGIMRTGEFGTGYSNSNYIVITEKAAPPPPEHSFIFVDTVFAEEEGCIYGAFENCTAGELLAHVTGGDLAVYDKNGLLMSPDNMLTTGCALKMLSGGGVVNSAIIIIRGDINCDGKIDPLDYLLLKRSLLGTITIEGNGLKAAFVAGKSNISVVDYIMIKRQYLGTFTIKQNKEV